MSLEFTPQFTQALSKMESGKAFVFVTGRAGTGKSTLLKHFVQNTKLNTPVLAPTGVAALNVDGETIHRFFKIPPAVTPDIARQEALERKNTGIYRKINVLVIDEISMVRADLLDSIDAFLRAVRRNHLPFGGVRVIGIGDLYQLPPVVTPDETSAFSRFYATPYFFSSKVYNLLSQIGMVDFLELEKVYRQKDQKFIDLLNAIRNRTATENDLMKLNARLTYAEPPRDAIILTPTNAAADAINQARMAELEHQARTFEGLAQGKFSGRDLPTEEMLELKVGARVMCVANDQHGRFVNGSLGWVRGFDQGAAMVELDGKKEPICIETYTWTMFRTKYVKKTDSVEREQIGSFKQLPLRLAWAVTIHKSQGKTFEKVTLDLGRGAFAAGQVYVALSRCTSLEGLSLLKPVTLQQIKLDSSIVQYLDSWQNALPTPATDAPTPTIEELMPTDEPVYVEEE